MKNAKELILKRINEREIYIVYDRKIPVGTVTVDTLSFLGKKTMERAKWKERDAEATHISALGVLPEHHGEGAEQNA